MAFQPGHPFYGNPFRGPAGAFPAAGGGLIHVSMDVEGLRRMTQNIKGQFDRSQTAIYTALREVSFRLMELQREALQSRIDGTARVQRSTHYLLEALVNERNRRITVDGFTVGYLDEAWSHVATYYRGIEEGTDVHTTASSGLLLRGLWVTPSGLQRAMPGGRNAIGFRGNYVATGGFPIVRPIPAYHYQEGGFRNWLREGYGGTATLEILAKNFDATGLDWLARFTRVTGGPPSGASVASSIAGIASY